jgi:hypothetical protein
VNQASKDINVICFQGKRGKMKKWSRPRRKAEQKPKEINQTRKEQPIIGAGAGRAAGERIIETVNKTIEQTGTLPIKSILAPIKRRVSLEDVMRSTTGEMQTGVRSVEAASSIIS